MTGTVAAQGVAIVDSYVVQIVIQHVVGFPVENSLNCVNNGLLSSKLITIILHIYTYSFIGYSEPA